MSLTIWTWTETVSPTLTLFHYIRHNLLRSHAYGACQAFGKTSWTWPVACKGTDHFSIPSRQARSLLVSDCSSSLVQILMHGFFSPSLDMDHIVAKGQSKLGSKGQHKPMCLVAVTAQHPSSPPECEVADCYQVM